MNIAQWDVYVLKHMVRCFPAWACKRLPPKCDWLELWVVLSALELYLTAPQRTVKISKSFYFCLLRIHFSAVSFWDTDQLSSLLHSWGVGGWNHLCFSINPAVYLWRDLIGGFCWSYCCMINILCIFIIIQNVDISRPTEEALVTVPAHQWILCPDQLSNLGAVSSCYFKINSKTNHSNCFEIKKNSHTQTKLITQTKCLYSTWLEKNYQITIKLLHWLIYCGWVIKPWSALSGMLVL